MPVLIILNSNFEIITELGRKDITDKGIDATLYWDYLKKKSKGLL